MKENIKTEKAWRVDFSLFIIIIFRIVLNIVVHDWLLLEKI